MKQLKRILSAGLVACLLLSAALLAVSCKKDGSHEETTTEGLPQTESCELPEAPKTEADCKFTVRTVDGTAVPNAKIMLIQNGITVKEGTVGTDGTLNLTLENGEYFLDVTGLPEGYAVTGGIGTVTVDASRPCEFSIEVQDNTPNGTEERPFIVEGDSSVIRLAANASFHYAIYNGAGGTLFVKGQDFVLTFNGKAYEPDARQTVRLEVKTDDRSGFFFELTNKTDAELSLELKITYPEGTLTNPIAVSGLGTVLTASITGENMVYYRWVADGSGVLAVTSDTPYNTISLNNHTTSRVSSFTEGAKCEYLEVSKGDTVVIVVAAMAGKEEDAARNVEFELNLYAGTKEDPIPVWNPTTLFSFRAGESYYFVGKQAGETVRIKSAKAELTVGDQTYQPDASGNIEVKTGADRLFRLTNKSDAPEDIRIQWN